MRFLQQQKSEMFASFRNNFAVVNFKIKYGVPYTVKL